MLFRSPPAAADPGLPSPATLPPPAAHAWLSAAHPPPLDGLVLPEDDLLGLRAFSAPSPPPATGQWQKVKKGARPRGGARPATSPPPPPLPPPFPTTLPPGTSPDDWSASPMDAFLLPHAVPRPPGRGRRLPVFVGLAPEE